MRFSGSSIYAWLNRGLSIGLLVCLLSSSTPAAPVTLVALARESSISLAFWYHGSGLAKLIQRGATPTPTQETQRDRDAKVTRIQISPGNVTVDLSDRVRFTAVAYDQNGNPVGGVKAKWSGQSITLGARVRVSQQGEFEATAVGTFNVVAEANGITAQVSVIVRPSLRRDLNLQPLGTRQVSTRNLPSITAVASATPQKLEIAARASKDNRIRRATVKRSHTTAASPTAVLPGDSWDDTNYWSADDPGNRVGDPPGGAMDGGAGSGNFQFAAPIYSSSGRGISISLGVAYNSRLWNKAGTQITYDIDRGWPAPGFNLGFGKMLAMGVNNGTMLIDADGTRHAYTGTITFYSWGTHGVMHTTDGSFIDYEYWSYTGGAPLSGQAKLPNGTVINYGASNGHLYPTSIEDANGNYITITYVNNVGPQLQTVTDSLGRVLNFYYDASSLLTAVTAPGLNGGAARTLVRLRYRQITLNYSFSGLTPAVNNPNPWVIEAIYYPSTNTGYWFGDTDSYSTYGMLAKVIEQRDMVFSGAPLNEQGTVTQGQMTRKEVYSYPLTTSDPGGSNLTDAPTYTSMTEGWTRDGTIVDSATTNYLTSENATNPDQPTIPSRKSEITLPNQTKSIQYSYNYTSLPDTDPRKALDGLVYQDKTQDAGGTPLQGSTSTWEKGAYDSPRPLRVEKTDEHGHTTAAVFSYGSVYNQVIEVRDYDYGGAILLRATRTQYQNSASYTSRHMFNLPLAVEVFAADNVTRVSRTEYQYDGQTLTDTPNVVMHDDADNPYAPQYEQCDCNQWDEWQINCLQWNCYWTSAYNPATDYRGNVTQVTSYADAVNLIGAVTETRRYDITGNVVMASTSCCEQTSFSYTVDTQYAYPESQTRGSATDVYKQVTSSATYDFNTALMKSATDANNRPSITEYDPDTLRVSRATAPTGAHTDYSYNDLTMEVTSTTYSTVHAEDETTIADQNIKVLNGRGQVRQEKARGPDVAQQATWDAVDTVFNNLGQAIQQSRPYRVGAGSPVFGTAVYDALGRTVRVTAPDGSVTETYYNEEDFDTTDSYVPQRPDVASTAPGETTLVRDAWGRERWGRTDASGRLVEVVEPNPSGNGTVATGGLVTTYSYNTLGNLTQIDQGQQTRKFKYDSLGRLAAQKLAEQNATLNDAGTYVGVGAWSDVFTYDERSNLTSRTDARGVKTVYSYNSDPLNRLQSVSWDTSGFGDTTNPILPAATVTYQYRQKSSGIELKDITQLESVTTAGVSTESYVYDSEGRVYIKTLTLSSRSAYPFETQYSYDALDRVTDVLYPKQWGNGQQLRKQVHHDYDIASRLNALTYDGQSFASNIVYNAASQTTSLNVGAGANQITENYSYNAQTGLLDNQTLVRGATTLLDLSYDYVRAGTTSGRTGQLTKILNNQNHNKDRGYVYDSLGRLVQATGGASGALWTQTYAYDRYGNRTSVTASGYSAKGGTGVSPVNHAQDAPATTAAAARERGSSPTVTEGVSVPSASSPSGRGRGEGLAADREPVTSSPSPRVGRVGVGAERVNLSPNPSPLAERGGDATVSEPSSMRSHHSSRSAGNDASAPSSSNHTSRLPLTALPQSGPAFTDDPLTAGVAIKAIHITELRNAINDARIRAVLTAATWAESVTSGVTVKASHITEMRARLDEARAALGLSAASYTDTGLAAGYTIKAIHIQELRDRVREALGSLPIPRDGLANVTYDLTTNRITTAGFEYDAAGNQVRALIPGGTGSQRYQYDAANRMVNVKTDAGAVIATYTYGYSNERLIAEEGSSRTFYVGEGGATTAEYTEVNNSGIITWSKSYVYLGNRLLSTLTANGNGGEAIQFHHPDRLGTRLVTDPLNGTFFEQQTLPFGTTLNESLPVGATFGSTTRRFTSYERSDTTKLDYALNRHYDAQQGRFTQVDPIGMKSARLDNPQTLNLYAYCTNDPVNHSDPDGLGLISFFKKVFRVITAPIRLYFKLLKAWWKLEIKVAKAIGRGLYELANLLAPILNNRYVRIALFIASFIAPFVPAIAAALEAISVVSDVVAQIQLIGQLVTGKFKEFGLNILFGYASATISAFVDNFIQGVIDTFKGGFSFTNLFLAPINGFREGFHAVFGRGWKSFILAYGRYCGPGLGKGGGGNNGSPVDGLDELCNDHDYEYRNKNNDVRLKADKAFFRGLFTAETLVRAGDIVFAGRPSGGNVYRFIAVPTFGSLIVYRKRH